MLKAPICEGEIVLCRQVKAASKNIFEQFKESHPELWSENRMLFLDTS